MVPRDIWSFVNGTNYQQARERMGCLYPCTPIPRNFLVPKASFFFKSRSSSSRRLTPSCRERTGDDPLSPYAILGVEPSCSSAELKAAFRAKVKQHHPDVNRGGIKSDTMIRRIIQAYEMLTNYSRSEIIESECLDPFDKPECEAFDVFVNEVLCAGRGCSYSCVKTAPHIFSYASTGTARAMSQGHGEDYRVQTAVGQCPRNCIHYVTPSQRIILEELLESVLDKPYDCSAEAELLYSLIVKAQFENNRYQKPKKRQPESSWQRLNQTPQGAFMCQFGLQVMQQAIQDCTRGICRCTWDQKDKSFGVVSSNHRFIAVEKKRIHCIRPCS